MARHNVRAAGLGHRISIRAGYFENARLNDATIAYLGLTEGDDTLEMLESKLKNGCKLVTLSQPLVGVIPSKVDFPFYLSKIPFNRANTIQEWTRHVLMTSGNLEGLVDELSVDPDYYTDVWEFSKLVKARFPS